MSSQSEPEFFTDDEEEYLCPCDNKTCKGRVGQFSREYWRGDIIQLYESEYWYKDCAIKQLGVSTDICTECYERPCRGRCIGCIPDPPEVLAKYDHKGNFNWTNEESEKEYYIKLLKEDDKKKKKLKKKN